MQPKHAIIIILSIAVIASLVVVYVIATSPVVSDVNRIEIEDKKRNNIVSENKIDKEVEKEKEKIIVDQKIEKIMSEGRKEDGGLSQDSRKEVEEILYQEVEKQVLEMTPEELSEREKRQSERTRIMEEINRTILIEKEK